jgi:LL-diaminopimelate aminotransferase
VTPILPPPPAAVAALQRAAEVPAMQRYGFALGHVPFREAIVAWMERRFGQRFDPFTEIVPLLGSKEGLAHVAFAYVGPGDVGIIPEPAYQAYLGGTLLSDAQPYIYALRPRTNFLVDLDEIPADVMARTRVLYLNYPNNPDRGHCTARLSRARGENVRRARHPAGVRQRVLGDGF